MKKLWDQLGSRGLSVFIFVMGIVYFLILFLFSTLIPLAWVHNIADLLPYRFLYLLFFVNLIICEIKWIPVVIRRCSASRIPHSERDLANFPIKTSLNVSQAGIDKLGKLLLKRGYALPYKTEDETEPSAKGKSIFFFHKGRFSAIGNLFFHLSFLFLAAGVFLNMFYYFDGTLVLAAGQGTSKGDINYLNVTAPSWVKRPEPVFEVKKIVPVFWMDRLLFKELNAHLLYDGKEEAAELSRPLTIGGARVNIEGIGITPQYVLKDREGTVIDNGFVTLNIFAPNSMDSFYLPNSAYQVFVYFYPDYQLRNNLHSTRSMNPVNPVFIVKVYGNERSKFEGIVRPGEEIRFDDRVLTFVDFAYSGIFKVKYFGGNRAIWTAFILMAAGLIVKFLFYRREIVIWRDSQGTLFLAAKCDYYRNLMQAEIERLSEAVQET